MQRLIWLALLLPTLAFASDRNSEIEERLDGLTLLWGGTDQTMQEAFRILFQCGQFYLYGCHYGINQNGSTYYVDPGTTSNHVFLYVPESPPPDGFVFSDFVMFGMPNVNPATGELDYTYPWLGGTANLTRWRSGQYGQVLVDDCDNPTVLMVPEGEPPSSRVRTNNGNFYRANVDPTGQSEYGYGPILNQRKVKDVTIGIINRQEGSYQVQEACSYVNDQDGVYDVYGISLKFNVNDIAGPWTYGAN